MKSAYWRNPSNTRFLKMCSDIWRIQGYDQHHKLKYGQANKADGKYDNVNGTRKNIKVYRNVKAGLQTIGFRFNYVVKASLLQK